jgi:hypothetical protein
MSRPTIRIRQLQLRVSPQGGGTAAYQALARSVATGLAEAVARSAPSAGPGIERMALEVPHAERSASGIARAIHRSLKEP